MVAILAAVSVFACPQNASAQECRMVKISGGGVAMEGKVYIEPEHLTIPKDTCVVWYNRARTNEVKVKFADGKKCEDVTTSEVGFKLDVESCFVTSDIPFGGTSSLNFVQSGAYAYVVESSTGVMAKGKIIVE
jgi:hypothetical protein